MPDSERIEQLRRRVARNPASVSFAALAEEYRRAGDYRQAVAVCRAGLARHPAYVSPRVTLAQALLALGHYDDARREFQRVLHIAPENHGARVALDAIGRSRTAGADAETPAITRSDRPAAAGLERFLAAILRVRAADERRCGSASAAR